MNEIYVKMQLGYTKVSIGRYFKISAVRRCDYTEEITKVKKKKSEKIYFKHSFGSINTSF